MTMHIHMGWLWFHPPKVTARTKAGGVRGLKLYLRLHTSTVKRDRRDVPVLNLRRHQWDILDFAVWTALGQYGVRLLSDGQRGISLAFSEDWE